MAINGSAYFAGNNIVRKGGAGVLIEVSSGYFIWMQYNIAWPLDANCNQQFIPGTCIACSVGYSIWNGRCVLMKTNCIAYSPIGVCMGCSQNYLLWGGECRESNCVSQDPSTGYCLICQNNFFMKLGVCIPNLLVNCQVYSGSTCQHCIKGYYVTNGGQCGGPMISNCLTASPQTGRCISCV